MKATLELPDELMRAAKIRAVMEDRKLKEMVADLLRRGLADERDDVPAEAKRVQLPLIVCAQAASPDDEMTPERVAEILRADDVPARGGE